MGLSLTNRDIDKYFRFLSRLDVVSKKRLIIKLTESIEDRETKPFDIRTFYGAWEDSRSSDEIISEIRDSRVDKNNLTNF